MYFIIKDNLSNVTEKNLWENTALEHSAIAYMFVI